MTRSAVETGAEQRPSGAARSGDAVRATEPATKPHARKQPARRYTPSQKAQALELAARAGSAAARELNVSRFALHQWQRALDGAAFWSWRGPSA